MTELVSQRRVASALGVTTREVYNLRQKGLPTRGADGKITYPLDECIQWYVRYREELAKGTKAATAAEVEQARDARTIAESKLIEMDLAEREGKLVTVEDVEAVVGEIGDRLRAGLINLPSNYILHMERAGVAPEQGQAILEEIAAELTRSLRGAAEEVDDNEGEA